MKDRRLLFIVNDAAFFLSHRLPIALRAQENGYEVHIATPLAPVCEQIREHGLIFHPILLSRSGKNPFKELTSIFSLYALIRRLKPCIVHLVTIKPVLYGGLIARFLKVPGVVAAVTGLGYVFTAESKMAQYAQGIIQLFYRQALRQPRARIIFQNPDDQRLFTEKKICFPEQTTLIRGSGVDLSLYRPLPETTGTPTVLMVSRLLKDKGVTEYVDAVRLLTKKGIKARFLLAGARDADNPACIPQSLLDQWQQEGHIDLLGFREDIAQLLGQSSLVVLPSYREGLPKVLIEAAASGRAVITTDVPGCRDAIEPNQTGLLVPVRDAQALAQAIECLLEDAALRNKLGQAGRILAEREFSIDHIVMKHLAIYRELTISAMEECIL
ncbi:MAG: glycosyltransferase family 1 protein [Legionella sp. 40-6]|nr:glycosyltransferase family 4 protein [Legionella sp.]OJX98944.1 MAG: glycosyltransferase family 1 protein [Legionella sp. 40-6]